MGFSNMIDAHWLARIEDAKSSKDNQFIIKIPDAGKIYCSSADIAYDYQLMHNGIKVIKDGYCGEAMTELIRQNHGIHEPQEERIFQQVLPLIKTNAVMVELGAYWAFYSLWFKSAIEGSKCYMVDECQEYLDVGIKNFELNRQEGTFLLGCVNRDFSLKSIMEKYSLYHIDVLHTDIQHAEVEMLENGIDLLDNVDYLFVSTHSDIGHSRCSDLIGSRMRIIADIPLSKSHSVDGLIVAQCKSLDEIKLSYNLK